MTGDEFCPICGHPIAHLKYNGYENYCVECGKECAR